MNVEKLRQAASVLNELSEAFGRLPESQVEAVTASLHCQLVNTYLVEIAKHLSDGMDTYDALVRAALGDTSLVDLGARDESVTTFNLMTSKPAKE